MKNAFLANFSLSGLETEIKQFTSERTEIEAL
jgi:hypothetical protein